jgi:hypothetical protein
MIQEVTGENDKLAELVAKAQQEESQNPEDILEDELKVFVKCVKTIRKLDAIKQYHERQSVIRALCELFDAGRI